MSIMSKPFVVACIPACDEERRIGGVEIVFLGVEPVRILARLGGGFFRGGWVRRAEV
jgi:hypothetical protein